MHQLMCASMRFTSLNPDEIVDDDALVKFN